VGQPRVLRQVEAVCIHPLLVGHAADAVPAGGLQAGDELHAEDGRGGNDEGADEQGGDGAGEWRMSRVDGAHSMGTKDVCMVQPCTD
jgi:hypothetical protein